MTDNKLPRSWHYVLAITMLTLAGCGDLPKRNSAPQPAVLQDGPPLSPYAGALPPDAVPRSEPRSKYGNPVSYVVDGQRYHVMQTSSGFTERGIASWYGTKFHGRRTSSGEPYDMHAMTAAHKELPIPCYVEVTNLNNGRKIIVRVNDRGPFKTGRIIDLSYAAAIRLGVDKTGTAPVDIRVIDAEPATPTTRLAEATSTPLAPIATASANADVALDNSAMTRQMYLQVGAFSDRANAERMLSTLLQYTAETVHINRAAIGNGEVIYRVRIGPFMNEDAANQTAQRLSALNIDQGHLVVE